MEKHVYFVRHGESESNRDGVVREPHLVSLTEQGRDQARAVAERIQRIGVDALVSSTYPRALQTADAISERLDLPIERSPLFVEWGEASVTIGRRIEHPDVRKIYDAMHAGRLLPDYRHSDEENFLDLVRRAKDAIAFLERHPASRICVVTHGSFLRFIVGVMVFRDDFTGKHCNDLLLHVLTNNTGVTYAKNVREDRGWQLVTWNDLAHLG